MLLIKQFTCILLILFASVALSTQKSPPPSTEYQHYCNNRFGFCVDHPKGMQQEFPENGDGTTLWSHRKDVNGLTMRVYGTLNNPMGEEGLLTPEQIMQQASEAFEQVTYQNIQDNQVTLSGYSDKKSTIIYKKIYVGEGFNHYLELVYPVVDKAAYDSAVTKISTSFVAGVLEHQTKWEALNQYIKPPNLQSQNLSLVERKKWYVKLAWPTSCEDDFKVNQKSHDDNYGGIELMLLDDERQLMAVTCRLGHFQSLKQSTRLFFIHNKKTGKTQPVKLPGFKSEVEDKDGYLLEDPNPPVFVSAVYRFNETDKTLIVLQKYRELGDCGLYAEYKFSKNNEVIVVQANERSCETVEESDQIDIDSWPEIQLTDHSETEWLNLINAEKLDKAKTEAFCKQLQASKIKAKQAQGYQCQAFLTVMTSANSIKKYPQVMSYYAKAIALMPKDRSLYKRRIVLGVLMSVAKDTNLWIEEGIKAMPYPQYIDYWLDTVAALQLKDEYQADELKAVQVINTVFPDNEGVLSRLMKLEALIAANKGSSQR